MGASLRDSARRRYSPDDVCPKGGQLRRFRRSPDEDGAAAVEFALLLPIFVMLVFGSISVGLAYWKHISDVQAARDAGRYGSTLPFAGTGTDTICGQPGIVQAVYLGCIRDLAISESANWTDAASVTANDSGYICVAYVKSSIAGSTGTVATGRQVVGVANGADPQLPAAASSSAGGCYDDGRTDHRVQVVIGRDSTFNAVLLSRKWRMSTRVSIPYERGAP
jgi:Flp pilus assembly protein TadG